MYLNYKNNIYFINLYIRSKIFFYYIIKVNINSKLINSFLRL